MMSASDHLASAAGVTVLPVPKPPGIATLPPCGDGEEHVEDALAGDQRRVARQPRSRAGRGRRSGQRWSRVSGLAGSARRSRSRSVDARAAGATMDCAAPVTARRGEDAVLQRPASRATAPSRSPGPTSSPAASARREGPEPVPIERRRPRRPGDEVAVSRGQRLQRALDAVEDVASRPGPSSTIERLSGGHDGLAAARPASPRRPGRSRPNPRGR